MSLVLSSACSLWSSFSVSYVLESCVVFVIRMGVASLANTLYSCVVMAVLVICFHRYVFCI